MEKEFENSENLEQINQEFPIEESEIQRINKELKKLYVALGFCVLLIILSLIFL